MTRILSSVKKLKISNWQYLSCIIDNNFENSQDFILPVEPRLKPALRALARVQTASARRWRGVGDSLSWLRLRKSHSPNCGLIKELYLQIRVWIDAAIIRRAYSLMVAKYVKNDTN